VGIQACAFHEHPRRGGRGGEGQAREHMVSFFPPPRKIFALSLTLFRCSGKGVGRRSISTISCRLKAFDRYSRIVSPNILEREKEKALSPILIRRWRGAYHTTRHRRLFYAELLEKREREPEVTPCRDIEANRMRVESTSQRFGCRKNHGTHLCHIWRKKGREELRRA